MDEELLSNIAGVSNSALKFIEELIKSLEKMGKDKRLNNDATELLSYMKNGGESAKAQTRDLSSFICRDFSVNQLVDELRKVGVPCITARCVKGQNQGLIAVLFKDEDLPFAMIAREKVLSCGRQSMDEYGNILQPSVEVSINTINRLAKDKGYDYAITTKPLDEITGKFFAEELRTSNVTYAKDEQGAFLILPDDKDRANACFAKTRIAYSGLSGRFAYQKARQEYNEAKVAKESFKTQEFFCIAAGNPKNVIHVTKESVTHQLLGDKNDALSKNFTYRNVKSEDGVNLNKAYLQELHGMRNPIVLSKDEYEEGLKDPDTMQKLIKQKTPTIYYSDDFEKHAVWMENQFKNAFNQKVYGLTAQGVFDPKKEKEELRKVRTGELELADYLEPKELAPEGIDDQALERKKSLERLCNLRSDEERENILNDLESYIDKFDTDAFETRELDEQELKRNLNDMIDEARNRTAEFDVYEGREESIE